jgi:hypothetical protein
MSAYILWPITIILVTIAFLLSLETTSTEIIHDTEAQLRLNEHLSEFPADMRKMFKTAALTYVEHKHPGISGAAKVAACNAFFDGISAPLKFDSDEAIHDFLMGNSDPHQDPQKQE